jgi:Ca2+-transporting ATPase
VGFNIVYQGVTIALLTLVSFYIGYGESHATGMTMAFLTLSMCEIFHSLNMRSLNGSIFKMQRHNKYLWGAMILSLLLTIVVIYIPGLNTAFRLVPLPASEYLTATALAFLL